MNPLLKLLWVSLGAVAVLTIWMSMKRPPQSDRIPKGEPMTSKGGDEEVFSIDQKPFIELEKPRTVNLKDLPEDLLRFYSRHEGHGLESSSDRIVRICKLSEVKPFKWKDIPFWGQETPIDDEWEMFSGYTLGISSFFDLIVYVKSAPSSKEGSILTIGADLAGPGGDGAQVLDCSLVLASSFDSWIEHLRKTNWVEYGIGPGSRNELCATDQQALIDYFKALNPKSFWKDAEVEPTVKRPE